MHKALWASHSHAKQAERTKQNPGPVYTQIFSRRKRPSCKGKYQTGSQMGEAQWPEDTASSSITETTGPNKWVEQNGEESKHPVSPSALPPPPSGRQTGGELFVDKSSMGSDRLVYRLGFCPQENSWQVLHQMSGLSLRLSSGPMSSPNRRQCLWAEELEIRNKPDLWLKPTMDRKRTDVTWRTCH